MDHSSAKINKLSFIHIPKTAGMSLHAELERCFGRENSIRFGNHDRRNIFLSMGYEDLKKYDYITGHITYSELMQRGIKYPAISIIREPVKRLVSVYNYLNSSDLDDHKKNNFSSFDKFVGYIYAMKRFNIQCRRLGGECEFNAVIKCIEERNLFVVPIDYYDDLIDTLSELLGSGLSVLHKNVTKYNTNLGIDSLDNELMNRIVGEDVKMYLYVKKNYLNLKRKFIRSLSS